MRKNKKEGQPKTITAYKDLLIISIGAVIVFIVGFIFDLADRIVELTARIHDILYPLDEILTVFIFLVLASIFFSWRRWRELRDEIAKRKSQEAEIRLLAQTVVSVKDCVSITDLENNIIFVNESFINTYGYSEEELIGNNIAMVRSLNMVPEVVQQILPSTLAGEWHGELLNRKKDGTDFPIELWTSIVKGEDDKPVAMVGVARDITERKNIEEILRQSESQFRSLSENSPNMIFINQKGRVVYVNKKCEEIMGYTKEEFLSPSFDFRSMIAPESQGLIQESFRKHSQGEEVAPYEYTLISRQGKKIEGIIASKLIDYLGGSAILGIITDITERKRIEEQIIKTSLLKQQLMDTSNLAEKLKLITDGAVEILGADFARIWMIQKADLCDQGCPHATVTEGPDTCRDRTSCLHLKASSGRYTHTNGGHRRVPFGCYKIGRVASGEDTGFITNDVTHDSRVHNKEWAKSLGLVAFAGYRLQSTEGQPIGVLALFCPKVILPHEEKFLEDLAHTASQVVQVGVAEEAILQSEERFKQVAESAGEWIWEVNDEGLYAYSNQAVYSILGYNPEEIIGQKHFYDFFYPDVKNKLKTNTFQAFIDKQPFKNFVNPNLHKNGSTVILETSGIPVLDEEKNLIGYRGVAMNITERKQREVEREKLLFELQEALANIKTLSGLIPICASCRKIRDDKGYWNQLEEYVVQHTDAQFSHGVCPDCMKKDYPDIYKRMYGDRQ